MIWNKDIECMSRDELTALQSQRLVKLVDYVYNNVEFYRNKMNTIGLLPSDIKGIEDITKLPIGYPDNFTKKYNAELCEEYNIEVSSDYTAI